MMNRVFPRRELYSFDIILARSQGLRGLSQYRAPEFRRGGGCLVLHGVWPGSPARQPSACLPAATSFFDRLTMAKRAATHNPGGRRGILVGTRRIFLVSAERSWAFGGL